MYPTAFDFSIYYKGLPFVVIFLKVIKNGGKNEKVIKWLRILQKRHKSYTISKYKYVAEICLNLLVLGIKWKKLSHSLALLLVRSRIKIVAKYFKMLAVIKIKIHDQNLVVISLEHVEFEY